MTFLDKVKFAKKLIKEYVEKYPNCTMTCSFKTMVLFHLVRQFKKDIPVVYIKTPFEFPEMDKFIKKMVKKYKINLITGNRLERTDMPEWWKSNPTECCNYYKVELMNDYMKNYDCWFSGVKRTDSENRVNMDYVVNPDRFRKIKVNPLLDFTELDLWRYAAIYRIPVNPLFKKGYRSFGCIHCSKKEKDEKESERSGRWAGTNKCSGECGLHQL